MIGRARTTLALLLWGLVIALGGALVGGGETIGQGLNHASLIVEFPDGHTETLCVEFSEERISGAELLRRSGLSVVFSSYGGLGAGVCRINDVGCSDPGDCFCQCRGADCEYWTYYTLADGEWRWQPTGASARMLEDGDSDAWVWGSGREPPAASGGSCAPVASAEPPPTRAAATPTMRRDDSAAMPSATKTVRTQRARDPTQSRGVPTRQERQAVATAQPLMAESTPEPSLSHEESTSAGVLARSESRPAESAEQEAAGVEESGGGAPVGLIAFGAVAAGLAAAGGAVLLRRRLSG